MDLHFDNPDLEAKISRWVAETGLPVDELVQDALSGYLNELAQVREMLDRRYDEVVSGKVQAVDGEQAFAYLRERIESRRSRTA